MSRRAASWLAYSMLGVGLLFGVLGGLLFFLNGSPLSGDTWYTLAFSAFPIVGAVMASHRPENPIGWLFCIIGLANGLYFFSQEYAFYTLVHRSGVLPGGVWLVWSQLWTASIMWSLMFFSLLLFPTGRLPSSRWRPVAWALAGVFILIPALLVIKPGPMEGITPTVDNPTGIEAAASIAELAEEVLPALSLIVVAAPASVIVRFWRSRGEERQQLKWLAYAAGIWGGVAVVGVLNWLVVHDRLIDHATNILFGAAVAPFPIAIGIAILRYRLYDIDVLINRTLVYGSLTASLVALYFGGIVLLQRLFVALTGERSTLAVVASTLLIAALFNPLRRRIQAFIDRRFYRRRYDARKTLDAFSATLRDETDLEALNDELVGVVSETMQPAHVSIWLRPDTASKGQKPV